MNKIKERGIGKVRTSFYFPKELHEAMKFVHEETGVPMTKQTQVGVKMYLAKYHHELFK